MSQTRALPFVLEVLDDGLRLYRRNLASFAMVASALLVVIAVGTMSFMAFVRSEIGSTTGWMFLAFFMLTILSYPLLMYTFAALSRATAVVLEGRPVSLLEALRLNPARGCGMLIFNILFAILAALCSGMLVVMISCPMMYLSVLASSMLAVIADSSTPFGLFAFIGVVSQVSTLWMVIIFGAWLASNVYTLQSFVLEQRSLGDAAARVWDLLVARFGRSILMFLGAGTIFGTLMIAYLGTLLALFGIIYDQIDLSWSPLVSDIIIIVLVIGSMVMLLPPLAIWMALFYKRLATERDGEELGKRVMTWRSQISS